MLFLSLMFVGLVCVCVFCVYVYIMCTGGQVFIDFEHMVLIGFAAKRHGLHFPFTCFMPLLTHSITPF